MERLTLDLKASIELGTPHVKTKQLRCLSLWMFQKVCTWPAGHMDMVFLWGFLTRNARECQGHSRPTEQSLPPSAPWGQGRLGFLPVVAAFLRTPRRSLDMCCFSPSCLCPPTTRRGCVLIPLICFPMIPRSTWQHPLLKLKGDSLGGSRQSLLQLSTNPQHPVSNSTMIFTHGLLSLTLKHCIAYMLSANTVFYHIACCH